MSFYQSHQRLTDKETFSNNSPILPPTEKEYEEVYSALKNDSPNATEVTKAYRAKYLRFVSETGRKVEMVRNFLKLAFLTNQNNFELGVQLMKDSLLWYPGQHWVMSRYTMLLENIGQIQQAGNNYWRLLRKYPENPHAYTQLGNFLIKHNFYNMAFIVYRAAVRNFPQDSVAHNCLADVYLKSGHFEKAIAFYKESVVKYPRNPVSITGLADAYLKSRKFDESITVYKTARHLFPEDPIIFSGLADAYLKSGKPEEAIRCYQEVLALNPDLLVSLSGLADAYLKNDQVKESIKTFEKALKLSPKNHVCLNGLGLAYLRQKNYAKAVQAFEEGVQAMPNGPVCYAGLALSLMHSGDLGTATRIYREGIERFPDNHYFYEGLAEAHVRSGKFNDAKILLEQALSKFNKIQAINFALAEVYMLNEQLTEATYLVEDNANYLADKVSSYSDKILLALLVGDLAAAKKTWKEQVASFPKEKEQLYLTEQLEKLFKSTKAKLSKEEQEKLKPQILEILSAGFFKVREEAHQARSNKNHNGNMRKYPYYFSTVLEELQKYQKITSDFKNPLMLITLFLCDPEEIKTMGDVNLRELVGLLGDLGSDYDTELFRMAVVLLQPPDLDKIKILSDQADKMIQDYGNKWELQVVRALFDAITSHSVDEVRWKNIYRLFSYHNDLNDYCYAMACLLSGDRPRSKLMMDRLLRKLQQGATRQKMLWLFHHSKTSIKDFPEVPSNSTEVDMLVVVQSLLSDFYLDMNEEH